MGIALNVVFTISNNPPSTLCFDRFRKGRIISSYYPISYVSIYTNEKNKYQAL
jgi:hypothetical protein